MSQYYGRGQGYGAGGPPPWAGGRGGGGPPFARQPMLQPLQPPGPGVLRVVATTSDGRGLDSLIAPRFARAPFITVVDISNGKVVNVKSLQNPYAITPQGAGIAFTQWIISSGARAVITPNVGPNAAMVLQQAGVAIYTVPPGVRLADALRNLGLARI